MSWCARVVTFSWCRAVPWHTLWQGRLTDDARRRSIVAEATQADGPFNPARRFIRHTADVPIEIRTVPGRPTRSQPALNVSEGGLSFISEDEIGLGSTIDIRIEHVSPAFEARAKVVWTREEGDAWCIGVQFLDANDAYRARMVEQIC